MKHIYNKLVRDHIPEIIMKDHKIPVTHILNDEDFISYLKLKLVEEANEVNSSHNKEELKYELADTLEVIETILSFQQISIQEIMEIKENKSFRNGKFNQRICLDYIETIDDK